jgi:hypothetical protein
MDLVDDATNTTLARLGEEETIWAAAGALRCWIERYGVPMRLYVDWKNLYKRSATAQERLRGEEPITQFGRMCGKLGIELIAANSPQAKGRVERIHGTHQDRLVKKLRRQQIASHAEANAYLEGEYLPEHNRRFSRAAARPEDYHRRAPSARELEKIFRRESERVISDDWVVRYESRFFQLEPRSRHYAPARGKVVVCEWPEGRVEIEYRGRAVPWREIAAPAKASIRESRQIGSVTDSPALRLVKRRWVPAAHHPWRQSILRGVEKRGSGDSAVAPRPSLALPSASP